jgi:hypothetical protein
MPPDALCDACDSERTARTFFVAAGGGEVSWPDRVSGDGSRFAAQHPLVTAGSPLRGRSNRGDSSPSGMAALIGSARALLIDRLHHVGTS